MSLGLNKVSLIGHLGSNPESKSLKNGSVLCNISLATVESYRDKATGQKKSVTEWHNLVLFDKLAEVAIKYLSKGSKIYVEGKIQTEKWQDKNGIEKRTTKIIVRSMIMLTYSYDKSSHDNKNNEESYNQTMSFDDQHEQIDDDIPF